MASGRGKILAAIVAVCVFGGGVYVALAALGSNETTTEARPSAGVLPAHANLMVRAVDPEDPRLNGRVFLVEDGEVKRRSGSDLACERVYFAAGRGICMGIADSGVDYIATIFDSKLHSEDTIQLTGLPSRARVSGDGRYGAMTVFVSGHAYLGAGGGFSTTTTIVDMESGESLGQLEQFSVSKDGQPFDSVDFNFWGITFAADSNRFYATLGTGGHYYLVEGSIRDRSMKILRDGVECPSLSPDGKRIAFKSRIGDQTRWQLRVLDLETLADHEIAETRSIDDQVEWLDDENLVYSDSQNVYAVPANGSGKPQEILRNATSPVSLQYQ
jgi:WD40-like Beta Propeller Repeat